MTANQSLATGYNTLYQGQSATGASPGVAATVTGVYNGNLAAVEGASSQPGSPTATTAYLPPGTGPKFPSPNQGLVTGLLSNFPARVTGGVVFNERAGEVAHHLGRSNSIRADLGQPITIGSIGQTGTGVTINSPAGGQLTIGQNLVAGNNATILGDSSTTKVVIGDNVTIGNGAVVYGTSLGSGSTVGDHAYVLDSTFPAGTQIPAGAIYDKQHAGRVRRVVRTNHGRPGGGRASWLTKERADVFGPSSVGNCLPRTVPSIPGRECSFLLPRGVKQVLDLPTPPAYVQGRSCAQDGHHRISGYGSPRCERLARTSFLVRQGS